MKLRFEIFILIKDRKVKSLTKEIAERYKTYKALRDTKGPHISFIYLNEKIKETEIQEIIKSYKNSLKKIKPFYVEINGIRYFKKAHFRDAYGKVKKIGFAVYVKVRQSRNLDRLYNIFNNGVENYDKTKYRIFKPHISIARKDLDKDKFYKIIKDYKNYKIKSRFLLKSVYVGTLKNKKSNWKLIRMDLG